MNLLEALPVPCYVASARREPTGTPVRLRPLDVTSEEVFRLVERCAEQELSLDCGDVEIITAAGLSLLLRLRRRLLAEGKQLRLFNVRPFVAEVFAVTRLNEVFEVRR